MAKLQETVSANRKNILQVKRDIIKLRHGQDTVLERLVGVEAWMKYVTGNLGSQKGQRLEEMVAVALRYGLKHPSLKSESIRLRQKLVDTEGMVFFPGYTSKVDLIAENGK